MEEKTITLNSEELAYAYSLIHKQALGGLAAILEEETKNLDEFTAFLISSYQEALIFSLTNEHRIGEEKAAEIRKAVDDTLELLVETMESTQGIDQMKH